LAALSTVTAAKLDSDDATGRVSITGGGALAVAARILPTFGVKCIAKSSAEKQLAF
jgi:hypothetical protein